MKRRECQILSVVSNFCSPLSYTLLILVSLYSHFRFDCLPSSQHLLLAESSRRLNFAEWPCPCFNDWIGRRGAGNPGMYFMVNRKTFPGTNWIAGHYHPCNKADALTNVRKLTIKQVYARGVLSDMTEMAQHTFLSIRCCRDYIGKPLQSISNGTVGIPSRHARKILKQS